MFLFLFKFTSCFYHFTHSTPWNHFINVRIYWSYNMDMYINPHTIWPYCNFNKCYTINQAILKIPQSLDYGTEYNLTLFNGTRATLNRYYFIDPLTIQLVFTTRCQYGSIHSIFDVPSKLYFLLME